LEFSLSEAFVQYVVYRFYGIFDSGNATLTIADRESFSRVHVGH